MKSVIAFLIVLFICAAMLYIPVLAEESEPNTAAQISGEQDIPPDIDDYGAAKLNEALPDEASRVLEEYDVSPDNGGALNMGAGDVFSYIVGVFSEQAKKPLVMLFSLLGIVLLYAALESLRDTSGSFKSSASNGAGDAFAIVAVVAGAVMISTHISECVLSIVAGLSAWGVFLGTFIPVFAGIMAITGQLATAGLFASIMVVAIQFFMQVVAAVLTPLTGCILGISVAGAITPSLNIDKLASLIKSVVVWGLGLITVIFVGMLSLQSMVTASADSVGMKAAKFAVSGAVPFIGSAVGDALATVRGSMGVIKASTGTFGIIAGLVIIAPSIILAVCYKFALTISHSVSDLFGLSRLSLLIKSGENVIKIVIALITCFSLLATVSIALILVIGRGE